MASKIAVIGVGRMGCVVAAGLAHSGHIVHGIDIDESNLSAIRAYRLPFYEPKLLELLTAPLKRGTLTLTSALIDGVSAADFVMVCIGTASLDGHAVVEPLLGLIDQLVEANHAGCFSGVIVIRSTVPPGTCERLILPRLAGTTLKLVFQPEFLREGSSVDDVLSPSLLVVGSNDITAAEATAALYGEAASQCRFVGFGEAEMIKYACNSFRALKVAFANEIGTLSRLLGVEGSEVMQALAMDTKLNASAAYLRPGFAFGGYCLPKDSQVLASCAQDLGVNLPILTGVLPSNAAHLSRSVTDALRLKGRIGVYGISFKQGTDDLRDSPAVHLAEALLSRGREVHLFDPAFASRTSGTPKLPETLSAANYHATFESWLHQIDAVVLTHQPAPDLIDRIARSRHPVSDCFGIFSNDISQASTNDKSASTGVPLPAPRGPLQLDATPSAAVALSIVVPTYQEASNIHPFLHSLCSSLDSLLPGDYEVIVVDDNSPDRTWQIALAAAAELPRVKVVRRQNEQGLATAVIRGWQVAHGRILGTINSDFQHPPDLIASLWQAMMVDEACGLAIATRYASNSDVGGGGLSLPRRVFSHGATRMARWMLPTDLSSVSDPMSGCYLFHRSILSGIELRPKGYKTLVEILVRGRSPQRMVEVPYRMAFRSVGRSKANLWRSFDFVTQLWRLRANVKSRM